MASELWADIKWLDGTIIRIEGDKVVSENDDLRRIATAALRGHLPYSGYFPNIAEAVATSVAILIGGEVIDRSDIEEEVWDKEGPEPIY